MKSILLIPMMSLCLWAGQYDKVKITPSMSYVYVYHKGKAVKVHRIQNTSHKLTGEYAKQYRPGKYIQAVKIHKDIQTIGEVELLEFMQKKGNSKKGIVIDVREKSYYQNETIPSSVNIPLHVTTSKRKMKKILQFLGIEKLNDSSVDKSKAIELVLFTHGIWGNEATKFINKLLILGYPSNKIFYYRGGIQMWKILGFTTVSN